MRKFIFSFIFIFSSVHWLSSYADETKISSSSKLKTIPELTNLQTLGQKAKQKNLPILLAFGAKWCSFCHQLRSDVLNPMMLSGRYEGKYMYMRYVSLDDRNPIPGFDGKPISKNQWAEGYGVDLTPTILFVDGNGKEVAPRMVGIPNIELYAAMIHKALNTAYEKMGNSTVIPTMPADLK
ncbi:thioredoxin family protein [Hydrogenovibrio kuenenii]|uniref:thioredoxin family protein n=1 Tax=Hydrogenovibrio kuenenii TaxID=63658 RepID=UPI0004672276|nr:thioredoxin fold domain-containing protein [Hydrogenovibrio kuenenii]